MAACVTRFKVYSPRASGGKPHRLKSAEPAPNEPHSVESLGRNRGGAEDAEDKEGGRAKPNQPQPLRVLCVSAALSQVSGAVALGEGGWRTLTFGRAVFNVSGPPKGDRTMNKATLKKFRTLLTDKRDEILKKAKQTLEQDMALDTDDLPDEMDLASSEYLQSFTFRLRGREKTFLDKIEKALKKIDEGTFGVCEECGEEISVKRLEARPETTLCIRCKEDQERMEKDYS
jgi:DnaK suppressor protein